MTIRPVPQICYESIKRSEGCSLKVYLDSDGCPTVGWGHQLRDGAVHKVGDIFTQVQCDNFLISDTQARALIVMSHVKVPLKDGQYAALISFVFNLGDVLGQSTLLKKLNAGDYKGASAQFLVWNRVNGQYNQAIEDRRIRVVTLFNS